MAKDIYDTYASVAKEQGYEPTPDNRGYSVRAVVADSDERAYEEGKHFYWQLGTSFGLAPRHWQAPPGYQSRAAATSARELSRDSIRAATGSGSSIVPYDEAQETYQIVTGNPDTVIRKLKTIVDVMDPSQLIIWGREGTMSHEVAMRSIDLMTQEVIPALKEYVPQGHC